MDNEYIREEFIKFLNDKNCEAYFLLNLLKFKKHHTINGYFDSLKDKTELIYGAFSWSETDQGFHYWSRISHKWIVYVLNLRKSTSNNKQTQQCKSIW